MPSPGNKPFPWDIVLWPFIWVFCTIADAWQRHRYQDPPSFLGTDPELPWVVFRDD